MLTVRQNMMPPTGGAGSYPRLLWFDLSLDERSSKTTLGESLCREQYLTAVVLIKNPQ